MKKKLSHYRSQHSASLALSSMKWALIKLCTVAYTCMPVLILTALCNNAFSQTTTATLGKQTLLSDEQIRKILIDRVDVMHKSVGMVVGIVTPEGRRIISYGQLNQGDPRPLNGETVFEIGSITKIFTALLLADMVQQKEMALTDPIANYLPEGTKVPEWEGRNITLADLATHTSGLPYIPSNMGIDLAKAASYSKEDIHKISCQYTDNELYQFLSTYKLTRAIGSQWEYSNIDYGLLGKALAHNSGTDYETLVHKKITGPLKMNSTAISISVGMRKRLGTGHDSGLNPAPEMCMPAMEAAGSLRSTANDLLNLLEVFIGKRKSDLGIAANSMLDTHRQGPGFEQALGWWVIGKGDDKIVFFGGETLGYTSSIAYDPKTKTGVVVLVNSDQTDGGLGLHILNPNSPLETSESTKKLTERADITVDHKILDQYSGSYKPDPPGGTITIERRNDSLVMKSNTTPPEGVVLHAENSNKFYIKGIDLQITFQTNNDSKVLGLTIHYFGKDYVAPRIEKDTNNKE